MKLRDIRAPKGANKQRTRIGRGHGSGHGKTAGRGHKGQKSRSGGGIRPGFEGGQMPLHRRLPKFGFTNIFRKHYAEIKLSDLDKLTGDNFDPASLMEAGLVRTGLDGIKILGTGDITRAISVKVDRITAGAKEKIEAAGGKVELIEAAQPIVEVAVSKAIKRISADVIDLQAIIAAKLAPEGTKQVRIVKRGLIKDAKTFRNLRISRQARKLIERVGGKIEETS